MSDDKPLASVSDIKDGETHLNGDEIRKKCRDANMTDAHGETIIMTSERNFTELDDEAIKEKKDIAPRSKLNDNTRYDSLPNFPNFDKERLETVEYLAQAMSQEEILDYFSIVQPPQQFEKCFFNMAYKRGVAKGKKQAMEKLFIGMGDRNGASVALKYLQTHASRFPSDGTDSGEAKGQFSFNINMDE